MVAFLILLNGRGGGALKQGRVSGAPSFCGGVCLPTANDGSHCPGVMIAEGRHHNVSGLRLCFAKTEIGNWDVVKAFIEAPAPALGGRR